MNIGKTYRIYPHEQYFLNINCLLWKITTCHSDAAKGPTRNDSKAENVSKAQGNSQIEKCHGVPTASFTII